MSFILFSELLSIEEQAAAEILRLRPLDLTLHAAEDEGRTEDATEHKKQKARDDEGKVFLTQELPQAAVILVVISLIAMTAGWIMLTLKKYLQLVLENPTAMQMSYENLGAILGEGAIVFLKITLPAGLAAAAVAALGTMLQTQFHFSTKMLQFDVEKIMPSWENLKKKTILSRSQVLNSLKMVVKLIIIFFVFYLYLKLNLEEIVRTIDLDLGAAFLFTGWMIFKFTVIISTIFLILAIPDYFIQKMEYEEGLKMTKDEVRRESREMEGNPEIKQKQKERAREYARRNMLADVKKADVIITNPDHFACAIKYDLDSMHAPKLLAKGMDDAAQLIKKTAAEAGIPRVENVPLARALYRNVEVGDFIPEEYFAVVAEVLAALDKFRPVTAA